MRKVIPQPKTILSIRVVRVVGVVGVLVVVQSSPREKGNDEAREAIIYPALAAWLHSHDHR